MSSIWDYIYTLYTWKQGVCRNKSWNDFISIYSHQQQYLYLSMQSQCSHVSIYCICHLCDINVTKAWLKCDHHLFASSSCLPHHCSPLEAEAKVWTKQSRRKQRSLPMTITCVYQWQTCLCNWWTITIAMSLLNSCVFTVLKHVSAAIVISFGLFL